MKPYSIQQTNIPEYRYLILSKSYRSPSEFIELIEDDLVKRKYQGNIAFDYLLSNGNNNNRYISAVFNGENIEMKSFNQLSNLYQIKFHNISRKFYLKNSHLLDESILSKVNRFIVKKGM